MADDSRLRGRPPEGVKIEVRLPAEDIAILDEWAGEAGVKRPALVA